METEIDCSACLTKPELDHAFNMRVCSSVCTFSSYFSEPMLLNTFLNLVTCFVYERSLLILKDRHNSINYFNIEHTCTKSKCGIRESSTSFSKTNVISLTSLVETVVQSNRTLWAHIY